VEGPKAPQESTLLMVNPTTIMGTIKLVINTMFMESHKKIFTAKTLKIIIHHKRRTYYITDKLF
jgi:hypothetical protein